MGLNQEENVCALINFDDGCLMEECQGAEKRKYLLDVDDSKSDKGCEDIADLLPNDPFEMEFNLGLSNDPIRMDFNISLPRDPFGMDFNIEATVAAITGWIEDFSLEAYGFETDGGAEDNSNDDNSRKASEDNGEDNGDYDNNYFAELNFVWTSSMKYEQEDGKNEVVDAGSVMYAVDGLYDDHTMLGGDVEDSMCFGCEKYENEHVKDHNEADGGPAVDILIFALEYLGVKDLLSVERVCKSLRDAVRGPYLWRKIHIDYPLSLKITNDDLIRLTDRAQGKLRSLSLVKCLKITNDGLKHVLESNLELTKLSVAECIRLSVEGILQDLKVFNSVARPGIKHLRIGEPLGLTNEHMKEFKLLLGADEDKKPGNYKPRFYRAGEIYLSLDDERAIDVETCPRCQKLGLVYDCPAENCQAKIQHSTKTCRACIFCIARCIRCGCCLDNKAYEETFCFELLCLDCFQELFNFQDGMTLSPGQTYFRQKASYHFFLYS